MRPGDFVCVLNHCYFPVVLRKVDGYYVYVGGCHELMSGEAAQMVNDGRVALQEIDIW